MNNAAGFAYLEEYERRKSVRKITSSLAEFAKAAWHIVEPSRQYVHGWHVDAISEHLEAVTNGEIKNLLINMPPRHMKSLLVSVFWPAWVWITRPDKRWIFASYSSSLSKRDSIKCRRIIESFWYREAFDIDWVLSDDQNEKMRYNNDRTGYRIATSVGGSGTGEGGDFIVVDDPHKATDTYSKAIRESVIEWWDEEMSTRGNDPKHFGKVIVMQRLHELDLSGHVIAQGGYDHLCLPCEFETQKRIWTSIGWTDPRTTEGELLWPDRFGEKEITNLKRSLGAMGTAGQLQQRPSALEGGIIKRKWMTGQFYTKAPDKFEQVLMSWDAAFKGEGEVSYVVGQVWGKRGAESYLLDQVRDRMDFPTTIQAISAMAAKWKNAHVKLIEVKANGQAVIDTLKGKIAGLIGINPEGSKEARLSAASVWFMSKNVWLPDPSIASWVNDYIEELVNFPNAAHNDQVDATSQALIWLYSGEGEGLTKDFVPKGVSTIAGGGQSQW